MRNAPSPILHSVRWPHHAAGVGPPPGIGTIAFLSRETAAPLRVTGHAHANVSTSPGGGKPRRGPDQFLSPRFPNIPTPRANEGSPSIPQFTRGILPLGFGSGSCRGNGRGRTHGWVDFRVQASSR